MNRTQRLMHWLHEPVVDVLRRRERRRKHRRELVSGLFYGFLLFALSFACFGLGMGLFS